MNLLKLPVAVTGICLATSFAGFAASVDLQAIQLNGNAVASGTSAVQLTANTPYQEGYVFTYSAIAIKSNTTF